MKSIDKLNNAIAKQGKKAINSNVGQKFMNSGAGQAVKSTVHNMADKNKFIGNVTGINANKAKAVVDDTSKRLSRMKSNPALRAHMKMENRDLNKLYLAEAEAIANSKRLQKLELNPNKRDKFQKVLAKHTKPERIRYEESRNLLESLPEYKTFTKIRTENFDSTAAFEKALRDTRNSRRALTGGVITTGVAAPITVSKVKKKKQEQDEINRIRAAYYM